MKPSKITAAGFAVAIAVPASAQGATLTVQGRCFASSQPVTVVGQGFTPAAGVAIGGDAFGNATADGAGSFVTEVTAPYNEDVTPRTISIIATESGQTVPAATTSFPVVRDAFAVEANLNGNPRTIVRWRFAGFPSGRPVYGHFRLRGRTIRNHRFGTAQGPCGTLTARARRLPIRRVLYGTWQLKFDDRQTYSSKTPGRLGTLTVFRRSG